MERTGELGIGKAIMSLFYGTVLGAFLTTMLFVLPSVFGGPSEVKPGELGLGAVSVFVAAFFIWGAGVLLLGAPVWWALHTLGFRGYLSAGLLGFILPVLALMYPAIGRVDPLAPEQWAGALWAASIFGAIGLVAGLYVRFLAYQAD